MPKERTDGFITLEAENLIMTRKVEKIRALKRIITANRLETCIGFWDYDDVELAILYNGVGPSSISEKSRKKITEWFSFFEASALDHDTGANSKDKSKRGFKLWNKRFLRNNLKLTKRIVWYLRLRKIGQAYRLYMYVSLGGWNSWINKKE